MPQPVNLEKAQLREIYWPKEQPAQDNNEKKIVKVQFNPQTLSLRFSNMVAGTDQTGGPTRQFLGQASTTLSLDLWFDVTAPSAKGSRSQQSTDDVRQLTKDVIYFIKPEERTVDGDKRFLPPGIRFAWGTFLFEGFVNSLSEDLEFFSEVGKPLRAKISLSITQQEIKLPDNRAGAASGLGLGAGIGLSAGVGISGGVGLGAEVSFSAGASVGMAGTQPLVQAQAGVSIQGMAASSGQTSNWKGIALANNIENPRRIEAGTLINTNVSGSIKVE